MKFLDKIKHKNIQALAIFLEKRKTRVYVGKLEKEDKGFVFEYSDKYIYAKNAIPIGPDILLTRKKHKSDSLFKSFNDRIPSSKNPSYDEYCAQAGISPNESNQVILLATIGRRGPSSFVFEPIYKEIVSEEELKDFRKKLGLTIREFSEVFDFSTATIRKMEFEKNSAIETKKRLKILVAFPEVAMNEIMRKGGVLHEDKKIAATQYLQHCLKQQEIKTP